MYENVILYILSKQLFSCIFMFTTTTATAGISTSLNISLFSL